MKNTLPVRKNIRLNYYDYSKKGTYFITICIKNRIEILGKINNNQIKLTKEGIIAQKNITNIEKIYRNTEIEDYVIMPNHIHMMITLKEQNKIKIPRIIKQYKNIVTKQIGYSIWQKSYYEHIIRTEKDYYKIKEYIRNNVMNWKQDKYF